MSRPAGLAPFFVAPGGLDLDGRIDLVLPNGVSGDVSVLLGNGDGSFRPVGRF